MSLPPGLINLDHYTAAAQAMSEMDEHKAQMEASRQVSQKVNMLGHGGALRNKIASFAGVRDDVRASAAPKRKRRDAHDFRNDLVNSFVPDYGYNVPSDATSPTGHISLGMTMIEHGTHQPRWLGSGYKTSDNTYLQYAHTNRDNFSGLIDLSSPNIQILIQSSTSLRKSVKQRRRKGNMRMIRASGDIKLLLDFTTGVNYAIFDITSYFLQYDLRYRLLVRLTVHDL